MNKRTCSNCKFLMTADSGYSNYTVEETTWTCLLLKHPKLPAECSYEWEAEEHEVNHYAKQCDGYAEGRGIHLDVELEDGDPPDPYTDDEEVRAAYRALGAK